MIPYIINFTLKYFIFATKYKLSNENKLKKNQYQKDEEIIILLVLIY